MNRSRFEVSVVIPVYNAEPYIVNCVDSLINQRTDYSYEIILVNDGSKDNSLEILYRLKEKDSRIKVYTKPNGGVSSARNLGIEKAQGRYIVFVDSDDWVDINHIQHLRGSVINDKHGVVFSGFAEETPSGTVIKKQMPQVFEPQEYHKMMDSRRIYNQGIPWGKIFDLETIKYNNIKFPIGIQFGEDLIFLLQYLHYSEYVKFIDAVDYHYSRMNEGTLIATYHSFTSEINGYHQFRDALSQLKSLYHICDSELTGNYTWLLHFALRAIKTIYRPGENYLPRYKRLVIIRNEFYDTDIELFASQLSTKRGIDKLILHCLINKYYNLLDSILRFFFLVRYSKIGIYFLTFKKHG